MVKQEPCKLLIGVRFTIEALYADVVYFWINETALPRQQGYCCNKGVYPSGLRGLFAKQLDQSNGAWVQISPFPPFQNQQTIKVSIFNESDIKDMVQVCTEKRDGINVVVFQ